ncbi:MAG TPA: helicase SNF2 [Planctomycetales bacterium]|jgi:superfamily II DNA or RNA helicase|nr:helicase SNF2 [Planctomycetales bacterium]
MGANRAEGAGVVTRKASSRAGKTPKLSRLRKPDDMSLEAWQMALRREFGVKQKFKLTSLGDHPIFSDFQVVNPQSKGVYRVAIRGERPGDNFCTCPDFATNSLGTCKHIEFTLAKLRRKPGGKTALRDGFQPAYSQVELRYGARREVRFIPGSDCPPELALIAAEYFGPEGILREGAFSRFDEFLTRGSKFQHEQRCYEDAVGFVAELRDAETRHKKIDAAFPDGADSPEIDKLLKTTLYDYQKQGALFAARAGRCLIGDEMGLGKTIQAIAAVEIMARHLGVERVLIICPTSLKHQWEREINRFANRTAQVIGGLRARRQAHFATDSFFKITNYDTVHRDLDLIGAWSPELVILDEAQRIKNWNTRAARSVKQLHTPYAIVLTGTPLENRLEELVSIVQFVDQHRLGPTFRFLADHQIHDEFGKVVGYRNLDHIGKTLEPILIRRRKDQVAKQLPERLDKHFFVPMTPQQMLHHDENKEVVGRIVKKWRRLHFLSETDQRRLMIALQNMRMSCDSTYLLDQRTDFGVKADELATLLEEVFEQPGTKVLVFSQWVRMHEVVQRRFQKRNWEHVLFHGSVPGPQRKGLVDRFRERDDCRAFLSTDAGGVGLNLQNASVVVNMDLPWNPAVMEQRIGRAHRLGQTQPVRVVNFIAKGTIEEGMLSVLSFKKSLFAGALDGGDSEVFLGGSRLKKFMETVEKTTDSIPVTVAEPEAQVKAEVEADEARESRSSSQPATAMGIPNAAAGDPWAGLLAGGLAILEQLAVAAKATGREPRRDTPSGQPGHSLVHRDPQTGEQFVRFPMPSPDVLDRALGAISSLLERFRG